MRLLSYVIKLDSSESLPGDCQQLIIVNEMSDIEVPLHIPFGLKLVKLQVYNRREAELMSGNRRFTHLSDGRHVVLESDSTDLDHIVPIPETHTIICTDFITIYLIIAISIAMIIVPIAISTVPVVMAFKSKGMECQRFCAS